MRWNELFDDLEARAAAQELAELRAEVADRTRRDRATVTLGDRLAAGLGVTLRLDMAPELALSGELLEVGDGWLLLAGPDAVVVAVLDRILQVRGLPRESDARPGRSRRRFGIGVVLRELARDRAAVRVHGTGGLAVDGVVDWVGADHVEICRRGGDRVGPQSPGERVLVPFATLLCVMSHSGVTSL